MRISERRAYRRQLIPVIFTLAWPTMLEQLMQTAVQYIDTAMVGTLGTEATAAVGATTTVNWLIASSVSALGVGFLACISQAFGAGDRQRAARASAQSVTVTVLVGLLFTALTQLAAPWVPVWMQVEEAIRPTAALYFRILYLPMLPRCASIIFGTVLRSAGDTRTPMRAGILVNILNVILNALLIYPGLTWTAGSFRIVLPGAGLGVAGAAAASAAAYTAGGIVMTAALLRHKDVSPRGCTLKPDPEILMPCLKVAVPNMLQRFCASSGYVVFASMINSLGGIATAAHTIANTVESAFYIPGYGMMTAAATLTGNCIGARDEERRKDMSVTIVLAELGMMTVSGALLFAFAGAMTRLFTADSAVTALSCRVLRMVALSEPFYGVSIVLEGMLQGAGETKRPFLFNVGSMWGVRILGTFVTVTLLGNGLTAAWACMIAGNMTLMAMYAVFYRAGRWNPLR